MLMGDENEKNDVEHTTGLCHRCAVRHDGVAVLDGACTICRHSGGGNGGDASYAVFLAESEEDY